MGLVEEGRPLIQKDVSDTFNADGSDELCIKSLRAFLVGSLHLYKFISPSDKVYVFKAPTACVDFEVWTQENGCWPFM